METSIYLFMIEKEEYNPKKHYPVNIPGCENEKLLEYYRGTSAALHMSRNGWMTSPPLSRIEPALHRAHIEITRRMVGSMDADDSSGGSPQLLFVHADLRIPEIAQDITFGTTINYSAEIDRDKRPDSEHNPVVQRPQAILHPAADQPRPVHLLVGPPDAAGKIELQAKVRNMASEDLKRQELAQVAALKQLWGNRTSLDTEDKRLETGIVTVLGAVRQELSARGIRSPTPGQTEETRFRQDLQQRQRAATRGRGQGGQGMG